MSATFSCFASNVREPCKLGASMYVHRRGARHAIADRGQVVFEALQWHAVYLGTIPLELGWRDLSERAMATRGLYQPSMSVKGPLSRSVWRTSPACAVMDRPSAGTRKWWTRTRAAGCRALSSARRLSAAEADPECDRIAAAQPANDRNGMYTGPTIEPAGGQEPARSGRSRAAALRQSGTKPRTSAAVKRPFRSGR